MLYREMPKTGDKLSALGFGCMRLPGGAMNPNEKESIKQIRGAIERGVNYLDTAWLYHVGKSEVILGKALKDGYREKVKIADKLPIWLCKKRDDMDYYLDEQLKRLDVSSIDYYLVHGVDGKMWEKAMGLDVLDFLEKAKASGKIINVGFSFHGPREDFKKIVDDHDWDFCQIQYNILDEHNQAGIEGLKYAASKDMGVIIMEPLMGGFLAGKQPKEVQKVYDSAKIKRSNVEWALRWIWNHPEVITVLSGMNSEEQIDENIRIASEAKPGNLSTEEIAMISKAADTFREIMQVPCTGCQYCMPCPKDINIPHIFSHYNNRYLFNQGMSSRMMYIMQCSGMTGSKPGLASQCVNCGLCVKHCPQSIDIPAEMKKVKKEFEGIMLKPMKFVLGKVVRTGGRKDK